MKLSGCIKQAARGINSLLHGGNVAHGGSGDGRHISAAMSAWRHVLRRQSVIAWRAGEKTRK